MNKLILLDRDGTIIENKHYLNDPNNIVYLPDVESALVKLSDHGFQFAVVTNQSGIPRGHIQVENMHEIHRRISKHFNAIGVEFKKYYYSPHLPESNHPTRKPNPGMLEAALNDLNAEAEKSWMIGDKMIDVEAGHRAGTRSALIGDQIGEFSEDWQKPEVHEKSWKYLVEKILLLS